MNYEKYRDQYVNKQELLIKLYQHQKFGSVQDSRGRAKAMLAIMDFPPADVAPVVHGHYIKRYLEETGRFDLECSNCKFRIVLDEYDMQYARFCNSCGAKMDEREGNEE